MISYSIKDLEKITGIKAHTIRIWEKRYGIVEPSRTNTNIRFYSDKDLRHLMNVAILNKYGYKISNLQSMTEAEINNCILELTNQDIDNDYQVDSLIMAMIELDEPRFEKIVASSILKDGFSYTFENLLHRFLEKVGILWQIGTIVPAQEHFIIQLIRRKLILAIDGQEKHLDKGKTFLLFLPENEFHELALLYLHFLIRKAGHKAIYLGQNVPLQNIKNVFDIHHVDYLLTSVISFINEEPMLALINELNQLYSDRKILLGGNFQHFESLIFPENFILFRTLPEFAKFLSEQ
jgi:DNA-binding transcriptional MerR regulator